MSLLLSQTGFVIRIFRDIFPLPGKEQLRLDNRPQKLFKGQAVVAEKAGRRERGSQKDTEPACCFPADQAAKAQIYTGGNEQSRKGAKELPGRQAEKDALLVLTDLFWYLDFYCFHLP